MVVIVSLGLLLLAVALSDPVSPRTVTKSAPALTVGGLAAPIVILASSSKSCKSVTWHFNTYGVYGLVSSV